MQVISSYLLIQTYPNEEHLSVYDPMNPRHGCSSCVDCQGCLSTYNACSRYDMVRLGWCSPIAPGFIILRSQEHSRVNHGLNMFEYGSTLPGSHQRTQGQGCGAGMAWDGLGLQIGFRAKKQIMDKDFEPGAGRHDTQHIAGFHLRQVDGGAFVPTSAPAQDFGRTLQHRIR